jgi:hypothetical protein
MSADDDAALREDRVGLDVVGPFAPATILASIPPTLSAVT